MTIGRDLMGALRTGPQGSEEKQGFAGTPAVLPVHVALTYPSTQGCHRAP